LTPELRETVTTFTAALLTLVARAVAMATDGREPEQNPVE
jgi:hypothetical protein